MVEDLSFCCQGCATVYSLIKANGLDDFYRIDANAGQSQKNLKDKDYAWLEKPDLTAAFYQYQDGRIARVTLELPQIHCTSCIWLLENLSQLHPGIRSVSVNFARRTAAICFAEEEISLRETAELLTRIGYPPNFQLRSTKKDKPGNRRLLYQIGLAGFTFGNIMLFSLPDYLGLANDTTHPYFYRFFSLANLLLSIPVLLYAGGDYLRAASRGLKVGQLNIDLPISIGLLALFSRSAFEVLSQTGPGYFDSLAGLLFFLLIGRWFQDQTFKNLSFDHDYKSYFPLAANRFTQGGKIEAIGIGEIKIGDRLMIRPGELIPADGRLLSDAPFGIDYAFVTGESEPQLRLTGDQVYAGGRATETPLKVVVEKSVDQSYLLQLWKEDAKDTAQQNRNLTDRASQYFTGIILLVATITFSYWWISHSISQAVNTATAVLIIACPCALALTIPFTYGCVLRFLGQQGLYLRSVKVVEDIQRITDIILDKTGTLTCAGHHHVINRIDDLSPTEASMVLSMVQQSRHPKSRSLAQHFIEHGIESKSISGVQEVTGKGLKYQEGTSTILVGSASFCGLKNRKSSDVFVSIDGHCKASFELSPELRLGIISTLKDLGKKFQLHLLSGDKGTNRHIWEDFIDAKQVKFQQSPFDKQAYTNQLQEQNRQVLMVGDGLNDTGALKAARVGVAVSDDLSAFSPACDGILHGQNIGKLSKLLRFVSASRWVLYLGYFLAIMYNVIGLSFAVQGLLSPLVAAILMPLSSLTIVLVSVIGIYLQSRLFGRKK